MEEQTPTPRPRLLYQIGHLFCSISQGTDELTTRTNASFTMKRFIDRVAASASASDPAFETTSTKILCPGLKNGSRSKNELVRAEILGHHDLCQQRYFTRNACEGYSQVGTKILENKNAPSPIFVIEGLRQFCYLSRERRIRRLCRRRGPKGSLLIITRTIHSGGL